MKLIFAQMVALEAVIQDAKRKLGNDIENKITRKDDVVVAVHTHYDTLTASVLIGSKHPDKDFHIQVTPEDMIIGEQCDEDLIEYAKYVQSVLKEA